jgi:hypothetical protein
MSGNMLQQPAIGGQGGVGAFGIVRPGLPSAGPLGGNPGPGLKLAAAWAEKLGMGMMAGPIRGVAGEHRDDLAQRVVWASQEIGDGLGFDILSFDDADDAERMLEVKTTGLGKFFPFYVTGNELRCSEDMPSQFHLFRVFDFGREPRLYILHGSLQELCQLEPVLYRATI